MHHESSGMHDSANGPLGFLPSSGLGIIVCVLCVILVAAEAWR